MNALRISFDSGQAQDSLEVKKIIVNDSVLKMKQVHNGVTEIVAYDFSNIIEEMRYDVTNVSHEIGVAEFKLRPDYGSYGDLLYIVPACKQFHQYGQDFLNLTSDYQFGLYAPSETEIDEPVDRYIRLPAETLEEFRKRVQARITIIAHRLAQGLPHLIPHLVEKSTSICNDIGADATVKQFDHAANSLKLFIGYIQRMMDELTSYDATTIQEIETLVEELEEVSPGNERAMIKLFTRQNFESWETVHGNYQVHAGMTEDGMPGRLVYNIAEQNEWDPNDHPGSNFGDFNTTEAIREFHKLSATCYSSAIFSEHDKVVRERDLVLEEYTPSTRLSTLLIRASFGNIVPSHLSVPTEFSPDVREYRVSGFTVSQISNMVIAATTEEPGATIASLGRIGDNYTIIDGENIIDIVVTSSGGEITGTYRIILS